MSEKRERYLNYKEFLKRSERAPIKAACWKWKDIEAQLAQAAREDPLSEGRWAVSLVNASAGDGVGIAPALNGLVQVLAPGKHGKPHRHSNFAIFIVREGRGYSVIDGERIAWEAGDVFFAPPWARHEHCNSSDTERAVLYTIQDVPTMARAGTWFFQGSSGEGFEHREQG